MSDPKRGAAEVVADTLRRAVELHQQGLREHAAALYAGVLTLDPVQPDALQLYGVLCAQAGDPLRAIALMERSLAARPDQPAVLTNLGNVLRSHGEPKRALGCYDQALQAAPAHGAAHLERSRVLLDLGRYQESIASADAALALDMGCADAFEQRGSALVQLHRFEEAMAAFRRATELDPAHVDALLNFAMTAHEVGLNSVAVAMSERALALDPDRLRVRLGHLHCVLPALTGSVADDERGRTAFADALARHVQWLATHPGADPAPPLGGTPTYYLAYREHSNIELLAEFGRSWCAHLAGWQAARGVPTAGAGPARSGRARIGIVSGYVRDHSVYNVITRSFLAALERAGHEVWLFALSAEADEETTYAAARVDHYEHGSRGLWAWAQCIAGAGCDVLVYPEIGMDELTLKLAGLRLAPVQAASWGHPETTGLPTIDYYVSAAAFEPPGAERYYSEQLVRLPALGCYLQPASMLPAGSHDTPPHLPSLGIDTSVPVYVCPGTPFKYAPHYDDVYARIAERVGRCQFVFFEFQQRAELSQRLFERLAQSFTARGLDWTLYLRLLPWLPPARFRAVCAASTGVLDTIGFSGFNTVVHVLDSGAPLVAWEGRMLRGRLASGTLRHLGVAELVACSTEPFVAIAARLAEDAAFATAQRERIGEVRAKVYGDERVVDELIAFVDRAVADARRGRSTAATVGGGT